MYLYTLRILTYSSLTARVCGQLSSFSLGWLIEMKTVYGPEMGTLTHVVKAFFFFQNLALRVKSECLYFNKPVIFFRLAMGSITSSHYFQRFSSHDSVAATQAAQGGWSVTGRQDTCGA